MNSVYAQMLKIVLLIFYICHMLFEGRIDCIMSQDVSPSFKRNPTSGNMKMIPHTFCSCKWVN